VFLVEAREGGLIAEGHCTAVEQERPWSVGYAISLDEGWTTRRAELSELSDGGAPRTVLEHDGAGGWVVDGAPAPALEGCLDVDLEASAFTNVLPVRRLGLGVGRASGAPTAWVRSPGLAVERLEQSYRRLPDGDGLHRYHYAAPGLGFTAELRFDRTGLGTDYPGLATRVL
jgi:hypothetical protein